MRKGLTILEVLLVVGVVALALAVLVLALAKAKRGSSVMKEGMNLRNIQAAMADYGTARNKGCFPGLTSAGAYVGTPFRGEYYAAPANAGNSAQESDGEGCDISSGTNMAFALLLEEGAIGPGHLVSPGETGQTSFSQAGRIATLAPRSFSDAAAPPSEVGDGNISHAMLAYGRKSLKPEWKVTGNGHAIMLATRVVFNARPGVFNSIWTEVGSGRWKGNVVHNDNSVAEAVFQSGDFATYSSPFEFLHYGTSAGSAFTSSAESSSVIGIFGHSNDMQNFDAGSSTGVVGSAND